jgi:hypothetical protein
MAAQICTTPKAKRALAHKIRRVASIPSSRQKTIREPAVPPIGSKQESAKERNGRMLRAERMDLWDGS